MPNDTVNFTVDAKLLRELGERLVGKPHIALAELIKNAYDADARRVEIEFSPDRIVVSDDGHGMTRRDFEDRWMRVGTTHKETTRRSPVLGRTMTGSKGVGRLAVQLLARRTEVVSCGLEIAPNAVDSGWPVSPRTAAPFSADIDWDTAIRAGDLTSVEVPVRRVRNTGSFFPSGSAWGTRITLTSLVDRWSAYRFRRLAQEIWSLQPPYEVDQDDPEHFRIILTTSAQAVYEEFDAQMRAILDIWDARVMGRLRAPRDDDQLSGSLPLRLPRPRDVAEEPNWEPDQGAEDQVDPSGLRPDKILELTVELRDGASRVVHLRVPRATVDELEFDLRIFDLNNRQPSNVKVGVARDYLDHFGGVGIYDQHFRLPYYGADQDWLYLDVSSASRLSASRLLPPELQVGRGMHDLPTSRRVFGRAEISTGHERDSAVEHGRPENEALRIQVTRDRLVANDAFEQLRVMLRSGLDLYAMEKARTRLTKTQARRGPAARPPSQSFSEVKEAIGAAKGSLPTATYQDLNRAIDSAIGQARAIEDTGRQHAAILGALATAGMTTLAYDHEINKQIELVTVLADELVDVAQELANDRRERVLGAAEDMRSWVDRASGIRAVIAPLSDEETRTLQKRYPVRAVAAQVAKQIEVLSMSIPVSTTEIPTHLHLPRAAFPAWQAIFQNLYLNAFNSLLAADQPRVVVSAGGSDERGWVAVEDNGYGIDLDGAERFWEPFVRHDRTPTGLSAPGLGGTGLGLTIVRMITTELGMSARFTDPRAGMSTRVELRWESPDE